MCCCGFGIGRVAGDQRRVSQLFRGSLVGSIIQSGYFIGNYGNSIHVVNYSGGKGFSFKDKGRLGISILDVGYLGRHKHYTKIEFRTYASS